MTSKKESNDDTINDDSNINSNSDKADKIAEKLKNLGSKPSEKSTSDSNSHRYSPLLITLLVALPVAGIIAYINMPEPINQFFSSLTGSSATTSDQNNYVASNTQSQMAAYPTADQWNRQQQEPEWVSQQRAEMEKRRAEFQKRNADNFPQALRTTEPPEPPQWVKDRQAEMQREMEKYQQQNNFPGNRGYNWTPEPPAYMRHPGNTPYQQPGQAMMDNQAQAYQNQNPVNAYPPQAQNQYNYPATPYYHNAPYYGPGPGYAPYGWNGYRYR